MTLSVSDRAPHVAQPIRRTSSPNTKGMSQIYGRRMLARILLQLGILLLLIEAIFLAEKFTGILDSAINRSANLWDVMALLTFTAPEVSDLALPLGLLIAVYNTVLRCREDRELLVLAGAGVGAHQIIRLVVLVGIGAQVFSLLLSGFVGPHAYFAYRYTLFSSEFRALRGGITPGQFYNFGSTVVFAGSQAVDTPERKVFMYRPGEGADRVIVADRARLEGPDAEGMLTLHLRQFTVDDFANPKSTAKPAAPVAEAEANPPECPDCRSLQRGEPIRKLRIGTYARELTIEQLFKFDLRGASPSEWTLAELASDGLNRRTKETVHTAEFGRRITRSMLCLIAPLLGLVALTFTTPRTQAFAMPLACAVLMSTDVVASTAIKSLAAAGLLWILLVPLLVTAVVLVLLARYTVHQQHGVIKPALGRS